jgi:hypothetical protein
MSAMQTSEVAVTESRHSLLQEVMGLSIALLLSNLLILPFTLVISTSDLSCPMTVVQYTLLQLKPISVNAPRGSFVL